MARRAQSWATNTDQTIAYAKSKAFEAIARNDPSKLTALEKAFYEANTRKHKAPKS